jgi:hypothetical protein
MGLLFTAATARTSTTHMPFLFTSITAILMLIQSTTTIISNSYYVGLFPFYLLNIFSALVADIILQYRKGEGITTLPTASSSTVNRRCLIASAIVSLFFMTLFFPWSIDVYSGYFNPPNTMRTEEFFLSYLLLPVIIPIIIPVSIVMSIVGGYTILQLMNAERRKIIFNFKKGIAS